MELKDKVIVITGASRGLGKAMAEAFAAAGAKLALSARSKGELEKVAGELGTLPVVADVTAEGQVKNLAEAAIEKYGRIDIWINNAGIWFPRRPIEETDWQGEVRQMLEVNLFGLVYGSIAAESQMKKQQHGVILNILSSSALDGRVGSSGYVSSKFAASGFTKTLRKETADFNIKVIGVYPGGIKTSLFEGRRPDDYDQYMQPEYVVEIILKNLKLENPEDEVIIKRG